MASSDDDRFSVDSIDDPMSPRNYANPQSPDGAAERKEPRDWVAELKESLNQGPDINVQSSGNIGTVPSNWRNVHSCAFEVELTRIGSFRSIKDIYSSQEDDIEKQQRRFLIRLLRGKPNQARRNDDALGTTEQERVSADNERACAFLDELVEAMKNLEEQTKNCYSESFKNKAEFNNVDSDQFVEMMVVDGCFVVELLRLHYYLPRTKSTTVAVGDDPVFANPKILMTLRRDLLLLQNQLPFFVLEKLYELINEKNNIDHQLAVPLQVCAVTFFSPLLPQRDAASTWDLQPPKAHLLEVFHSTFLRSVSKNRVKSQLNSNGTLRGLVLHFASELEEAGVRFKKWEGHDILDIKFSRGTLQVPPLSLNDHTFSVLLNLVAYELRIGHRQPVFTNYLLFWTSLVNSPKDVQILHKYGIINNAMGDNVAYLLLKCREVIYDRDLYHLYDEIRKLNEYCERYQKSTLRKWGRSLMREHCSSPWKILAVLASVILLLLTALQTFYTVYPYYHKH